MGFLDGEGKRVVARVAVESAGETDVPRLYVAWIDDRASEPRLENDGVDATSLQLVEDLAEFIFLLLPASLTGCHRLWPVQSHDGGQPDGSHFVFWGSRGEQKRKFPSCQFPFCRSDFGQEVAFLMQALSLGLDAEERGKEYYNNK